MVILKEVSSSKQMQRPTAEHKVVYEENCGKAGRRIVGAREVEDTTSKPTIN